MGNRSFLYLTDTLPTTENPEPVICHEVGNGNNFLPPLWRVLFSSAINGPAQDMQQVFFPSVCAGIYAERGLAEQRLFTLLDFVAKHPMLSDPDEFTRKKDALRLYFATLSGAAYSADLNEYFMLGDRDVSEDAQLGIFMEECSRAWQQAERAMVLEDYASIERLYDIKPSHAADSLGFKCWSHAYFSDWRNDKTDATFSQLCIAQAKDQGRHGSKTEAAGDAYVGHNLFRFVDNGKVGLRRHPADPAPLLPALYDEICDFDGDLNVAYLQQNGLWGIYDAHGKIVFPPVLDELYEFQDGAAVARYKGRYGYMGTHGQWLIEARFDDAFDFSCGLAAVVVDGLTGYINLMGAMLIAPQFLDGSASFVQQGVAAVRTVQGYGVIDTSGAFAIPASYSAILWLESLQAWELKTGGGQTDVFFADGRPWFSGTFDSIACLLAEGDAVVELNHKYGTFQREGPVGIPLAYRAIDVLVAPEARLNGITRTIYEVTSARRDCLKGACWPNGELCIPLEFLAIELLDPPAQETAADTMPDLPPLFLVMRQYHDRGVWSIAQQRQILPCEYDTIDAFRYREGWGLLAHKEEHGYVIADPQGKPISSQPYDWLYAEDYEEALNWQLSVISRSIGSDWSQCRPIYGWRDGRGWRLHADGREESELDYQTRLAFDGSNGSAAVAQASALKAVFNFMRGKKSHAIAGASNADACKVLGDIYTDGLGVDIDLAAACRWYASGAAGGNKEAQYLYGYALMEGLGCEPDAAAARNQIEPLTPDNKLALNCLAFLYECRLDSEIDPVRARALYLQAAEGGQWGLALAQNNAGNCWFFGIGGPVDKKIALEYYELAAKDSSFPVREGNANACRSAAGLYCEQALAAANENRSQDQKAALKRAIYYYKEMLEYGLDDAYLGLARCHLAEYGGKPNRAQAKSCLRHALASEDCADEAQELWDEYTLDE